MGNKNYLESILEHPIASFFIADVVLCGIAKVIYAIRGEKNTKVTITTTSNDEETESE